MTDVDYEQDFFGPAPTGPRLPWVKLAEVGDYVSGFLLDWDMTVPLFKYQSTERETDKNGKEMTQSVISLLLDGPQKASIVMPKDPDEREARTVAAEPGQIVAVFLAKGKDYDLQRAAKAFGPISTSVAVTVRFASTTMDRYDGGKLTQAKHVYRYEMRMAGPDDEVTVERARAERATLKAARASINSTPADTAASTDQGQPVPQPSDLF